MWHVAFPIVPFKPWDVLLIAWKKLLFLLMFLNYSELRIYVSETTKDVVKIQHVLRISSFLIHCKLTRRRRSNSIGITVKTLWLRCSLVLILRTRVREANLFGYITQIQNIFFFNSSSIKEVMIKKHLRFQSYAHFTLVWRVLLLR